MGSIKIFNNGMSCFFANGYGDGSNVVEIRKESDEKSEFLGHFTVKKEEAYLSIYDCEDKPIYTFKKGRYFVHLKEAGHFIIYKCDNNIHG
jgi:hypothetical protein